MSKKRNTEHQVTAQKPIENFHRGSIVEFMRSKGIPSENTTHEKIGQAALVFTKNVAPYPKDDDSIYATIRYLKYKFQSHKRY
jgi:hypothetical protein